MTYISTSCFAFLKWRVNQCVSQRTVFANVLLISKRELEWCWISVAASVHWGWTPQSTHGVVQYWWQMRTTLLKTLMAIYFLREPYCDIPLLKKLHNSRKYGLMTSLLEIYFWSISVSPDDYSEEMEKNNNTISCPQNSFSSNLPAVINSSFCLLILSHSNIHMSIVPYFVVNLC